MKIPPLSVQKFNVQKNKNAKILCFLLVFVFNQLQKKCCTFNEKQFQTAMVYYEIEMEIIE